MANDYSVVGERIDDEQHLLVVGDDGQHYDYSLQHDDLRPVEPDERWRVDADTPTRTDGSMAGTDARDRDWG